ncbi:MAG: hypothetical protein GF344_00130 [Chitinivibrionales bacterium]|nr:hypothetical protein [Chitinivibrionales bacterium]MBD3355539.1 hypothetical protein [Chitinivibrionales bacterium]
MISPRLFYFNADFDFSLAGAVTEAHRRAVAELSALLLPLGSARDRVLMPLECKGEYTHFLADNGIEIARASPVGVNCEGFEGVPWGWDNDAVEVLRRHGARCVGPSVATVRNVNSRLFCYRLCKENNRGVPGARLCYTVDEVRMLLRTSLVPPFVIKPFFGSSGYGFIRKDTREPSENEIRQIQHAVKHGGVIVEPWLDRILDISSRFVVKNGRVGSLRHQRMHANRAGAFYGNLLVPDDPVLAPWREQLDQAATLAAEALGREGYFGPAGIDSFVYRENGGDKRLVAMNEINARIPMSAVAHALYGAVPEEYTAYFRFIGRRRHRLPDTYDSLHDLLGTLAFDRTTYTGVLPVTPLRVRRPDESWRRPSRTAFFVAGDSERTVLSLDEALRKALAP